VNGDMRSTEDHRINNIPPDCLNPVPSNFIDRELTREGMKTTGMAAFGNNQKDRYETTLTSCLRRYLLWMERKKIITTIAYFRSQIRKLCKVQTPQKHLITTSHSEQARFTFIYYDVQGKIAN